MTERDPAKGAPIDPAPCRADAAAALEDLRDLARGIYPPLLADQGLAAALEAQARKVVAARPASSPTASVGTTADVETAVYFCALEALNNVAKYAGRVDGDRAAARRRTARSTFEVADDGRGFDPARPATAPACRGWPTGSTRSAAPSRCGARPVRARR